MLIQSFSSLGCRTTIKKSDRLRLCLRGRSSTAGRNHQLALLVPWIFFLAPSVLSYLHRLDITCLEDVEHHENFVYFFPRLLFIGLMSHHFIELIELDRPTPICIQLCNHLVNGLSFGLYSKSSNSLSKFLVSSCIHLGSIEPPWSRSKRSKTIFSYITSSRDTKGLTNGVGSKTYLDIQI